MASLFAGSVAGAIGVGISYPFDTLSTKAQVDSGKDRSQWSIVGNVRRIWKDEGIGGFFDGVLVTMIGQAFIKAVQFAVNDMTFQYLDKHSMISSNAIKMAIAGTFAGLLSSFVVSPVELVKIRMQLQSKKRLDKKDDDDAIVYRNEFDCARQLVQTEGWRTLFFHGLGVTIVRETPSFALYFAAYGLLSQSSMADILGGHAAPLVFGAIAGWAMWIPTYPVDIVKTIVQAQQKQATEEKKNGETMRRRKNSSTMSAWRITAKLYETGGVRAFFDGLEPKLARAAVKHAVTFWVYEILMGFLR